MASCCICSLICSDEGIADSTLDRKHLAYCIGSGNSIYTNLYAYSIIQMHHSASVKLVEQWIHFYHPCSTSSIAINMQFKK